ncbi:MAG: ABC transporter permease [Anaerolineaceae bacterium]|nr:ABC transporter permease [Anaerolineaceae bacterium]
MTKFKKIGSKFLEALGQPLVAILISLLIGAAIIGLSGKNVLTSYGFMLKGAFGDGYYLSATLQRATAIIMGGLSVCIAWRSGYEAMGGEGQMIFGALVSALIAYYMPGSGPAKILTGLLGAALVGALYCMFSGWLWERFGVTFIISGLMLNYIANYIASYLTTYIVKDPQSRDINSIQTGKLAESARFGKVSGLFQSEGLKDTALGHYFKDFNVHWGFFFALICALLVYILLKKTRFGYESKMNGLNSRFALYGGINARWMLYLVMILSGAAAGLGGAFEVFGSKYRYIDQMIFSTGYAWSGMVGALLANFDPFGTVLACILLAGMSTGGSAMQRSAGIPVETVNMLEGIIMLLMSVKLLHLIVIRHKVRREEPAKAEDTENAGKEVEA